jgi:hypothetical protein
MPPIQQRVRLHLKVLVEPVTFPLDDMIQAMREVFEAKGIGVEVASEEELALPQLEDLAVGGCVAGSLTAEQRRLFTHRDGVANEDICVYLVRSTVPATNGCAAHLPARPAVVVASRATRWTLAHEIGHVLGLPHVNPTNRLMTTRTEKITDPPPDLVPAEVKRMLDSPFTR